MYLILPAPPSLNDYYVVQQRGQFAAKVVSKSGKQYHRELAQLKQLLRIPTFTGDLSMTFECFPYSRNSRDLDNYLKALCDAMQSSGIIENDNNIRWQLGKMQSSFRDWPCVIIRIENMDFQPVTLADRIREIELQGEMIFGLGLAHPSVMQAMKKRPQPVFNL